LFGIVRVFVACRAVGAISQSLLKETVNRLHVLGELRRIQSRRVFQVVKQSGNRGLNLRVVRRVDDLRIGSIKRLQCHGGLFGGTNAGGGANFRVAGNGAKQRASALFVELYTSELPG
jgi:hypothetical protein